jgi:putative tryptophan/tyrosine transport system substrate-binding protein
MRRREFILSLGLVAAWPLAARAQAPERARRIAVMMTNAEGDPEGVVRAAALREGLAGLGWTEGRNLRIDWHWSGGDVARISATAAQVTAIAPDLIVANGSVNLAAIKQATGTIPIVFVLVNDPLGQGFVSSLAQPGGNITGFAFVEYSMFGKSLELLKQLAPGISRVAFLFNPDTSPYYENFLSPFADAARKSAVAATGVPVHSEAEIDGAVGNLAATPGGGLIVPPDTYTLVHRGRIVDAASRHHVPAIYSYRQLVKEGGLLSYGPDTADIFRRAAAYVDRILKDANPADLPVQAPTKFELTVNLRTAAALGLTVPPRLAALADEVIE